VQSFLGFCNFYQAFLKDYGRVTRPLSKLIKKGAWYLLGEKELKAFKQVKALILSGGVIKHYLPFQDTRVETDVSDGVVAGVLNQL